jgi:hypothetical protein
MVRKILLGVVGFLNNCVFGTSNMASVPASGSAQAFSDQQLVLIRKDIKSIKKQLIAANLTLTDSEATKFWPCTNNILRSSERSTTHELR